MIEVVWNKGMKDQLGDNRSDIYVDGEPFLTVLDDETLSGIITDLQKLRRAHVHTQA